MLLTRRYSLQSSVSYGTVVLVAGLVASGCGRRDMGRVEGRVTFREAPVADAVVNFLPANRPMAVGRTDADGRFVLSTFAKADGAIGGQCQVVVVPFVELPNYYGPNPPRPAPAIDMRTDIPKAYRAPSTSPLTAEVQPGRMNSFEFALE